MAPDRRRALARALAAVLFAALAWTPSARAARILDYNVLNYPGNSAPARNPMYQTVIGPIGPDLMIGEEITSQAGVDGFRDNVLNVLEPGQWASAPFVDGNDTDCALFYKPAKFTFLGQWGFYGDATLLRLIHVYRVRPVGYSSGNAEIRLYGLHLKASDTATDRARRLAEATTLRDSLNAMPPGTHAFAVGDFNFYGGTPLEGGLGKLIEIQANNVGRLYDPLGFESLSRWQDNATVVPYHTQSPCLTLALCASGASTGGLDDRFDLWLPTLNWNDGQGYELLPGGYVSVGNDAQHLNKNITDAPTIPEGSTYANALIKASDHLPVRLEIQLPALAIVASSLDLGTVIAGGSVNLSIGNGGVVPADGLTYSLSAPPGFAAPAGTFEVMAGAPAAQQPITAVEGAPFGARAGTLTLTSDDIDQPSRGISLTANVLDHALASLDSEQVQVAGTIDFGTHAAGGFAAMDAAVHNLGFDPAQARLSVSSGVIAGGDGRFSIVGGFSPSLLSDVGQRYSIAFDDAGATQDSTYEARLTFQSADEPLPGAQPQPDLVVTLSARVTAGAADAGPGPAVPGATLLHAPYPNPVAHGTTLRFDLARPGRANLEVLDLAGRHVATVSAGDLPAGRYAYRWNGHADAGGSVQPGLYFVRLSARGQVTQTARLVVVR